jgi:hypothetical protein
MKYSNIDELDTAIERRADHYIKAYYTDWKNYDRPTYMGYKGSQDRNKKHILIMFRECGSYIFSDYDFKDRKSPAEIVSYYLDYESKTAYFFVDLEKLTLTKASPEAVREYVKGFNVAQAA